MSWQACKKERCRAEAQRRGGKDKGLGPEKTVIITPLKSDNHLIDQQWVLIPSLIIKQTLWLVLLPHDISSSHLCAFASLREISSLVYASNKTETALAWTLPSAPLRLQARPLLRSRYGRAKI
jgi:hypothetical protein